tara:strand:+ start:4614 stop:5204 length:591 start_codon:yes stop_codon:yes gene_type:complete
MNQSEQINELAAALSKAQSQMSKAKMTGVNERFKNEAKGITGAYAKFEDIREAVQKPFADNGLSYVQFPYRDIDSVGCFTQLMHSSGQYIVHHFGVPAKQHHAQEYGSILTYVRKYCLAAVAGLASEEDTDANEVSVDSEMISKKQLAEIKKLLKSKDVSEDRITKWKNIATLEHIKAGDFDDIISKIEAVKVENS